MVGHGHVYQSRYKSFPVESGDYFYHVMRYVERNALRSNLVAKAEQWQYGSLWISQFGTDKHKAMLSKWPLPRPRKWVAYDNEPASKKELEAIRRSCVRGSPYGSEQWVQKTAKQLGLESTLRRPGRPKKE